MEKKKDVITIDVVRPTGPRVIPEPLRSRGYLERYVPRHSISRIKQGSVAVAAVLRRPRVSAAAATVALAVCAHLATSTITHFVAMPFWTFMASNKAAMDPAPAASYQGPGDIVSGATAWGSCARAYNAALATTSTSLCDLVDSSTGVAVGTLRATSAGTVDLSAYFAGSVTPAAACAAASGGLCRVSKIYDQLGGSGWVNATNSQRPTLTFAALNGLPGWACASATTRFLATTTTYTFSAPYTWVAVAKRTSNFTTIQAMGGWTTAPNGYLGFAVSADTVSVSSNASGIATLGSVTDNSFHAVQGYVDPSGASATGVVSADGVDGSAAVVGSSSPSTNASRVCRSAGGNNLDGVMMEFGLWQAQFDGTQRTNINSNIHGTNGYNF